MKLNGSLVSGGRVSNFQISPDGSRVVYTADQDTLGVLELYSVAIAGGAAVKLNGPLVAGGRISTFSDSYGISPDGSRVVYRADQDIDNVAELYAVPIGGGAAVKLNGSLVSGGDVQSFQISPDGSRIVYWADQDTNDVLELYSVPAGGGASVKLHSTLLGSLDVLSDFQISPDSSRVVYWAEQDADNMKELYGVPLGGGTVAKLSGTLPVGGNVQEFQVSPDGSRALYRADQETDEVVELYVTKPQVSQAIWETSGGDWFAAGNWKDGIVPEADVAAVIAIPAVVNLSSGGTPAVAEALFLGGAGGPSVVELSGDAVLTLPSGASILSGGVLQGDGLVSVGLLPFSLPVGAELRSVAGEQFTLLSGPVTNAGSIEAAGWPPPTLPAEIEFGGAVTNEAATGIISGHDSILRFQEGLVNEGSVGFSGGVNDVRGEVVNTGLIGVSGGAAVTFYDDVTNNGAMNVSAAGVLQSSAVFFGALTGAGIGGGGHVFVEGDMRPGFSAGTMAFGGDLSYGPFATLEIEIGGTTPGSGHDQLTVNGHLTLNGTLEVTLLDPFTPRAGDVFDLWDAGSVSGQFLSVSLPALPVGLFWHTGEANTTGELRVGLTPESYSEFAAFYGVVTPPAGDEEMDGLSNLFEYLVARNPVLIDTRDAGPEIERIGVDDHYRFVVASPAGSDVTVEVETSTTLQDGGADGWITIASRTGNGPWSGSASVVLSPASEGLEEVTVIKAHAGEVRRFYRLKIGLAP